MRKKEELFFIILIMVVWRNVCGIQIKSIYDIVKEHSDIEYIKCSDVQEFEYEPFFNDVFFDEQRPHKGFFAESFIAKIPNGIVFSEHGFVKYHDVLIAESIHQDHLDFMYLNAFVNKVTKINSTKLEGTVAVIASGGDSCYGHWIADVLAKCIILQESGIQYDYIYVQYSKKFMKQYLFFLGIDESKIIEPKNIFDVVEAKELLFVSYPGRREIENKSLYSRIHFFAFYYRDFVIYFLRNKFIPMIIRDNYNFSKKVFISRNDAGFRIVEKEDEVFELFEKRGFQRYCLSELSVLEQIALFNKAEIIVGAHSSGFANLIYCNSGAKILEIFQQRFDLSFYYISQQMNLDYDYIFTTSFCDGLGHKSSKVSIDIIKKYLDEHPEI